MESATNQLAIFLTTYGLKIVGAIIILIVGRIAAGIGRRVIRRILEKSKVDPSIIFFVESLTYFLILTFAVLAALAKFGIQTASFVAVLGATGFAVGFALQGSLANFAAGVMILGFRPFKEGDFIIGAGESGTVKEISLFTTILATPDNIKIMIPNGKLFGDIIKNVSAFDTRRVDLVIGIGYGSDIQKAIDVITNLLPKVQKIIIGGGMTFTFYKSLGYEIGNSLLEEDKIDFARDILKKGSDKIVLAQDCVISDHLDMETRSVGELKTVDADAIPTGWTGLDIGSKSVEKFRNILHEAKTVVWNGPMGVFEIKAVAAGTYAIAEILAEVTARGATTVIGGGDSASAVRKAGVADKVSHVSTGGGASLEFIEGKMLPGVEALTDK